MPKRPNRLRRFLVVVMLAGALGASVSVIHAAFFGTTANSGSSFAAGSVVLTDNDNGGAAVTLNAAQPGATDTGCIKLDYSGSLASTVRHYATVAGSLAPYLTLKVTRGTDSSPSFRTCTNFTPDTLNYVGAGNGVLYSGLLSNYPTSWASGIVDPSAGSASTYSTTIAGTSGLQGYWRLGDVYASDDFTDTAATPLENHTGELDATWTQHAILPRQLRVSSEGRVYKNGNDGSLYFPSGSAPGADYAVETDVHVKSLLATDASLVLARMATVGANPDRYTAGYIVGLGWAIYRTVGGTTTQLGTYAQTLTAGNTYRLRFELQGTALRLFVDGVQRISVTDAGIAAGGRTGINLGYAGATGVQSDTAGLHQDNYRVVALTALDSQGTNNGSYGGTDFGPGALAGDSNWSRKFDGVDDYVRVARQIQDDFTLEFWFKSTQGLNTNAQWWGNAGLVDAEVAGPPGNDFGVSLRSDGKITAGTGTPDTTIVSATGGLNDGRWHHVAFTRVRSTGALVLYVDGASEGTATGGTQALNGPAEIDFGRLRIANNYFAGHIDEVATYTSALSGSTVQAHYASNITPEVWTNPETHSLRLEITLANTPAVEGLSSTATFRWEARNQ